MVRIVKRKKLISDEKKKLQEAIEAVSKVLEGEEPNNSDLDKSISYDRQYEYNSINSRVISSIELEAVCSEAITVLKNIRLRLGKKE